MNLKLNSPAIENKAVCLAKHIPEKIAGKIWDFMQNNTFSEMAQNQNSREACPPCCPRCLKAHILKTAKENNFSDEEIADMLTGVKGEIGHNGYYLNGAEVVKI